MPASRAPFQRSEAGLPQATGGGGRPRGPRYNGAERASLRPPAVDAGLAGPGTTELSVPLSGHLRLMPASRPPAQRTRPSPSPATWGGAPSPGAPDKGRARPPVRPAGGGAGPPGPGAKGVGSPPA